jgi:hypothetical protein
MVKDMSNTLLRLVFKVFSLLLISAPAMAQQPSSLLAGISRCGANAVLMNAYHKQSNQIGEANEMERAAFAYAKTTLEIGISEGLTRDEVVTMNKGSNRAVGIEFRENPEKFISSIGIKNKSCLDIMRANQNVAEIFGKFYREAE